ncbi:MAG: SirB2 family protein [Pseudomonadota bacterium]
MDIASLKAVHISCVAASYGLFVTRGIWMLRDSALLQRHWVKIVPHAIDSLLLASAILLAIAIGQYPFVHDWLTAKAIALAAYILLGTIALKRGKTKHVRLAAWIVAQAVFFYIITVALTRRPLPW